MIFTCDVKSDIVVTGGVIVGSVGAAGIVVVVYYNFFPIFKFLFVVNINVFGDMTKNETTIWNKF